MSVSRGPRDRSSRDAFYTPVHTARACVSVLGLVPGTTVWEPHAGGGAFAEALRGYTSAIYLSDVYDGASALVREAEVRGPARLAVGNFLTMPRHPALVERPEWIVGNPPFVTAEEHVRHALTIATVGVAFLLRTSFYLSAKREAFWLECPRARLHGLTRRPSFLRMVNGRLRRSGTDACDYAMFVWPVGALPGAPRLYRLDPGTATRPAFPVLAEAA